MTRPVFAYDVDLQVTDVKTGLARTITRTEQAYDVYHAWMQAIFNTMAEYPEAQAKAVRIGPTAEALRAAVPDMARQLEAIVVGVLAKAGGRLLMAKPALTLKQARFVAEYLVDLNAKQAAIRSGYSRKTAEVQGSRLLRNAQVASAVKAGQVKAAEASGITQERVLAELELLAFSDVTHYTVDNRGDVALAPGAPAAAMRALQSIKRRFTTQRRGTKTETTIEVELKLWDKPGPLKLAGRHVGLFPDKVELSGPNGSPIKVTSIERVIVRPAAEGG